MSMRYTAGFISAFYNPLKNPDAPTIGTATATSATSISVAFTAPANVGGSAITSYLAIAKRTSDGVLFTASGASSPISITGLTAVAFTATVAAVNSYGPSAPSATSNSVTPAMQPGEVFGGGFFAGQISTAGNGIADYNLVIGPVASAQNSSVQWKIIPTGGDSENVIDGPANSAAMNSATYPAAQFCEGLTIGGFSDWYMPAKNELDICYFGLKPTTASNTTLHGTNLNAVPTRTSNYTTGTPAQTSAAAFITGTGAEAFTASTYWNSTQKIGVPNGGGITYFNNGYFNGDSKLNTFRVRATRRVAV